MPRITVTEAAARDVLRCQQFLRDKAPEAAKRAGQAIKRRIKMLEAAPSIGRPLPDEPNLRELVIPFGSTGYVALYRHMPEKDVVVILALRHQKEPDYG